MYYVLMEIGWNYNDEVYLKCDGNEGYPKKVYSSEEKAEQEAFRLNMEEFKKLIQSGELVEYSYDINDILTPFAEEKIHDKMKVDSLFEDIFGVDLGKWCIKAYDRYGFHKQHPIQPKIEMSNE